MIHHAPTTANNAVTRLTALVTIFASVLAALLYSFDDHYYTCCSKDSGDAAVFLVAADEGSSGSNHAECRGDNRTTTTITTTMPSYVLLAVSGTLEEGFELRQNMDYRPNDHDGVNATLLGKALVRGYRSFLDIKSPTWREYRNDDDGLKTVNPAVVPTGCDEHANRYSVYAVDSRQALQTLAGEPRFLAIAPDMGLTDLTAADDLTTPDVKKLARAYTRDAGLSGILVPPDDGALDRIALLTVTSTWTTSTMVPNGVVRVDTTEDGTTTTILTDWPESTAIWSADILNHHHHHGTTPHAVYPEGCGSVPTGGQVTNVRSSHDYNTCIDAAVRRQEEAFVVTGRDGSSITSVLGPSAPLEFCAPTNAVPTNGHAAAANLGSRGCHVCQYPARYGASDTIARFNRVMTACELEALMVTAGVTDERGESKYKLGCAAATAASSCS